MLELKKEKKGKWFVIPNEPFGAKTVVKLKLAAVTRKELLKNDYTETKFNKKTHEPYEYVNKEKQIKQVEDRLFSAVLDWEGVNAEFNRENWDVFIDNYGMIKLYRSWDDEEQENEDIYLSGWITNICLNPKNFLEDDTENLVPTS
ncbi:MAG: hypothetical protein GY870_15005 [archaeon]|nr:hypothetical protein [archaeon]